MKIKVKNLGILDQAEFSLGDFTIICGENNTGKTYATYALYGFLDWWQERFDGYRYIPDYIFDEVMHELKENGVTRINLAVFAEKAQEILNEISRRYASNLSRVFAASDQKFKSTRFQVLLDDGPYPSQIKPKTSERKIGSLHRRFFSLSLDEGSEDLEISLLVDVEQVEPHFSIIERRIKLAISEVISEFILAPFLPTPFIVSAERTGAAIFRKELNFARNRLLQEMIRTDDNVDPRELRRLLHRSFQDYPSPVEANVEFTRQLASVAKQRSFLAEEHPEVLAQFADIIGGEYSITRNDDLYFIPKGKRVKLRMDESASGVRSMLDIGFYLRHVAKRGTLLMVDEPELNLHPKNQRRITRLFARLVNLGIKVFITTHSDYIVKELNTLIMLNQDKPYLKRIAEKEGYHQEEIISPEKIKVYIAEKARVQTLVPAKIDPELGIEARSFDETINAMNDIHDAIVWGDDD